MFTKHRFFAAFVIVFAVSGTASGLASHLRRHGPPSASTLGGCAVFTNVSDGHKLTVQQLRAKYKEPPAGVLWFQNGDATHGVSLRNTNCTYGDFTAFPDPPPPPR